MKKWMYQFIPMETLYPEADMVKFNRMGEEGWELVSFENGAAWFKKENE